MRGVNPDSYCGIYCGACSVAIHGETGSSDGFVDCLWSVPKEEIACGGCKSEERYAGCTVCVIRDCAQERLLAHCIDCSDYPCRMLVKWRSAARVLPHLGEAVSSLETIKRDGSEAWLSVQQSRWSCPDCGAPFSWYASACHACGHKTESYRLAGWRKLLGRLVLPMAYRKAKSKQKKEKKINQ